MRSKLDIERSEICLHPPEKTSNKKTGAPRRSPTAARGECEPDSACPRSFATPPRCHSPLPSCHPRAKRRISMGNTSESRGGLLEEDRRTRRASNDTTSAPANAKRTPIGVLCVVSSDLNRCYIVFCKKSNSICQSFIIGMDKTNAKIY